MTEWILNLLNVFSKEATTVIIAMLPLIELKGAIPIGISLGLSTLDSFFLSYLGSCIPVPFILMLIKPIFSYLRNHTRFSHVVEKVTKKNDKNTERIKKYGAFGLFLFVAIPLPGTGVWSGSLAAALLNLRIRYAMPIIYLGNLVAGLIVMILSHGFVNMIA